MGWMDSKTNNFQLVLSIKLLLHACMSFWKLNNTRPFSTPMTLLLVVHSSNTFPPNKKICVIGRQIDIAPSSLTELSAYPYI